MQIAEANSASPSPCKVFSFDCATPLAFHVSNMKSVAKAHQAKTAQTPGNRPWLFSTGSAFSCNTLLTMSCIVLMKLTHNISHCALYKDLHVVNSHVSQPWLIWVDTGQNRLVPNQVHDISTVSVLFRIGHADMFPIFFDVCLSQRIPRVSQKS